MVSRIFGRSGYDAMPHVRSRHSVSLIMIACVWFVKYAILFLLRNQFQCTLQSASYPKATPTPSIRSAPRRATQGVFKLTNRRAELNYLMQPPEAVFLRASRKLGQHRAKGEYPSETCWAS